MEYLTRDEIRKISEFMNTDDLEGFLKYIDNFLLKEVDRESISDEQLRDIFKEIFNRISKDDYEILATTEGGKEFLRFMIIQSDNKELIMESIKNDNYGWNSDDLTDLIIATGDKDFIKNVCIQSEAYGLYYGDWNQNIMNLIIATQDEKFAEYCKDLTGNIRNTDLIIATGDKEFIKECLMNDNEYDKKELLIATKDKPFIKACMKDKKYGWTSFDLKKIMEATGDKEFIKECIEDEEFPWNRVDLQDSWNRLELQDLIAMTKDKEYIKKRIKENKQLDQFYIIKETKDPDFIKECIEDEEFNWYSSELSRLIVATKDREYIKKSVKEDKVLPNYYRTATIKDTQDLDFIKECIEDEEFGWDKDEMRDLIVATKDKEYIKKCIQNHNLGNKNLSRLIIEIDDKEYIKECIQNKDYNWKTKELAELLIQTGDKDYIKEWILNDDYNWEFDRLDDFNDFKKLIDTQDDEVKQKIFEKMRKKGQGLFIIEYRKDKSDDYLIENIESIMQMEGIKEDILKKKEIVMKMYEVNNDVLRNINFQILEDKYIEAFGIDKINQISCYSEIQEAILELNDQELDLFSKCIDGHIKSDKPEEWTMLTQEMLYHIWDYEELVQDISQAEETFDIEKVTSIIQNANVFSIKSLDDVKKYEEIRKQKCDIWIKRDSIEWKKQAVLEKIYGQNVNNSSRIIAKYGEDIENIENEECKEYIKSLEAIINLSDGDTLERIYNECNEIENIDGIMIEKKLKAEYGKLYNDGLFKIEHGKEIQEGLYEAGTDFKMIITSISAYVGSGRDIDNYQEDWNRPSIASQHFCTSYIRNDMLGTAPINNICYGFSSMSKDALLLAGENDLNSSKAEFVSYARRTERYYAPENQINNTISHNELDFARVQDGRKKQPDYIVMFRENGEIKNMEDAQKASKDWRRFTNCYC